MQLCVYRKYKTYFYTVCHNTLDVMPYLAFQHGELPPLLAKVKKATYQPKLFFKIHLDMNVFI